MPTADLNTAILSLVADQIAAVLAPYQECVCKGAGDIPRRRRS